MISDFNKLFLGDFKVSALYALAFSSFSVPWSFFWSFFFLHFIPFVALLPFMLVLLLVRVRDFISLTGMCYFLVFFFFEKELQFFLLLIVFQLLCGVPSLRNNVSDLIFGFLKLLSFDQKIFLFVENRFVYWWL